MKKISVKDIPLDELSKRLTARMDETGITIRALAEETGITQQYISEIRRATRICSFPYAVALAHALDVSVEWLCGLSDSVYGETVEEFTASTGLSDAALYNLRLLKLIRSDTVISAINALICCKTGRDVLRIINGLLETLQKCNDSETHITEVRRPDGSTDYIPFNDYAHFFLGGTIIKLLQDVVKEVNGK